MRNTQYLVYIAMNVRKNEDNFKCRISGASFVILFSRFHDKVQINILNGPSRQIPVTGYGLGTTVVTDPPMSPNLNLGPHFSKGPFCRRFTLTNCGRRHQSLVWSTEGFGFVAKPFKRAGQLKPINPKDMKFKVTIHVFVFLFVVACLKRQPEANSFTSTLSFYHFLFSKSVCEWTMTEVLNHAYCSTGNISTLLSDICLDFLTYY